MAITTPATAAVRPAITAGWKTNGTARAVSSRAGMIAITTRPGRAPAACRMRTARTEAGRAVSETRPVARLAVERLEPTCSTRKLGSSMVTAQTKTV